MEVVIIVAIIIIVIMYFKRFSNVVYSVAIIDIFLRILNFIKLNIGIPEVSRIIAKYFPANIPEVINKYANGVLADILVWGYVILFIVFEFYIIRSFFKNKKL